MTVRLLLILFFLHWGFGARPQSGQQAKAPLFREKVYLRTDKSRYIAGETLWWKAYYVNGYTQRPDSLSKIVYVEIINDSLHRIMQVKARLKALGADGSFFLPGTLPSGEYLVRAYTRWIRTTDPQHIFSRKIQVLNANHPQRTTTAPGNQAPAAMRGSVSGHTLNLSIATDVPSYGRRKPAQLIIHAKPGANLSVAVYNLDGQSADTAQMLYDYLWSNELPDLNSGGIAPSLDSIDLLAEIDGHIISGRITDDNGQPVAGIDLGLAIPSSRGDMRLATTNHAGRFWFDVRNYYGLGNIFVRAINPPVFNYKISIDNPFDTSLVSNIQFATPAQDTLNTGEQKEAIAVQVQNIYWSSQLENSYTPMIDTTAFYGSNFVEYLLDDYVRFPSMQEVLTEYVPEVNVRRPSRKPEFRVLDVANKIFFVFPPLILLDGVPVLPQQILDYDPLKIRRMRIVTSNYFIGPFSYGGIISFTTYREDAADLRLDPKTLVMHYDGLQLNTKFFSPSYDTPAAIANRKPDFRSLLYWNPEVVTNEQGEAQCKFFTGDLKGRYLIVVEGMDIQGNAGAAYTIFEVK